MKRGAVSIFKWFFRLPYTFVLYTVRLFTWLLFRNHVLVWARNSYLKSSFTPFRSDLDLTLFVQSSFVGDFSRVEKFGRKVIYYIPIVSEINLYFEINKAEIIRYINPFELARDPWLVEKLGHSSKGSHAQKVVFLLRMIESDLENLLLCPMKRIKKWSVHLNDVGEEMDFYAFSHNPIRYLLKVALKGYVTEENILDIETLLVSGDIHDESMLALFPQKFGPFLRHLESNLGEIVIAQVEWEIFAQLTQSHLFSNGTVNAHLGHLRRVLSRLENDHLIEPYRKLYALSKSRWIGEVGEKTL